MHRPRMQLAVALLAVGLLTAVIWRLGNAWVSAQRDLVVARLAEQLGSTDEDRAVEAIYGLAHLNEAGAAPLVAAAMGTRPRIAPAARWALDDMLARWQRQSRHETKKQRLAERLERLSGAMVGQLAESSPEPLRWARQLAERMLRLTADLPSGSRLGAVEHCSSVLHFTAELANTASTGAEPAPSDVPEPLPLATSSAKFVAPAGNDGARNATALGPGNASPRNLPSRGPGRWQDDDGGAPSSAEQIGAVRARFSDPRSAATARNDSSRVTWQPDRKIEDEARSSGIEVANANRGGTPYDDSVDNRLQTAAAPPGAQTADEQLLRQLAQASPGELDRVQEQLKGRGWGTVPAGLAKMLISRSATDRLSALDALRNSTGVNPRPALMMLTADPDPDVRLAVVTLLATSRDPELIEQAWQTAIRDEDPRVARLADWLQENRRR